jgi:DUF4097 and DUF4098 domain-containing protein YvlB
MKIQMMLVLTVFSFVAHAQNRRPNRSARLNVDRDRPVTNCGDIRVTYDRRPAITEEADLSLPAAQVSTLRTRIGNGGIYVNGWDRNEYSVKTCKAVPDDSNATSTLRDINTTTNGNGELTVSGPTDRDWTADLIIMVPRLSRMDVETRNGPLQLREFAGQIHAAATNGPIGLNNVGGVVEATTTNGPITVRGASGDQHVTAVNGPIHVELSGSRWDGPGLEVSTKNGPLSVSVPDGYASGISLQTSQRSPVNCNASVCAGTTRTPNSPNMIRIGSGDPIVKLSTSNGPVSIQAAK